MSKYGLYIINSALSVVALIALVISTEDIASSIYFVQLCPLFILLDSIIIARYVYRSALNPFFSLRGYVHKFVNEIFLKSLFCTLSFMILPSFLFNRIGLGNIGFVFLVHLVLIFSYSSIFICGSFFINFNRFIWIPVILLFAKYLYFNLYLGIWSEMAMMYIVTFVVLFIIFYLGLDKIWKVYSCIAKN